jgi:hypothetical protein
MGRKVAVARSVALVLALVLQSRQVAAVEGVPCPPEPTDMSVAPGDLITCTLDTAGDSDTFRFGGSPGEVVTVRATRQSGSLSPCVDLVSPTASHVTACANWPLNEVDTVLDEAGEYSVLVDDFFGTLTGGYALSLERLAPPSGGAPILAYGESVADLLEPVGDVDLYQFWAALPGDSVVATVTRTSGSLSPCIELVAPDNARSSACDNAPSNQVATDLATSGPHALVVTDFFGTVAGGYSVTLQCVSGDCGAALIFWDGFESGGAGRWSATVP